MRPGPSRQSNFSDLIHNVEVTHDDDSKPVDGAQSIRRCIAVLRTLATSQERGMRLVDVAAQCDLKQATAHRLLRVLVDEGLAEQDVTSRRYVVGQEAFLLGLARRSSFRIRKVASPFLQQLCDESEDSVFLTVRSGADSICVDRKTGRYPIQVLSIEIGARRPLGVGVGGLAILAFLPRDEAAALLHFNAARFSREELSVQDIESRVDNIRRTGFAYTEKGLVRGMRAVAVPVFRADRYPVAAISISTISARLSVTRARDLVTAMQLQATRITKRLAT